MPKKTVDWNSIDTWKRLSASIVATGVKIDYAEIAKFFGTTYDTIETRFRAVRTEAKALQNAFESVASPEETASRHGVSKSKPKKSNTARKSDLHSVASGRISKSTPLKKQIVKNESLDEEDDHDGKFPLYRQGDAETVSEDAEGVCTGKIWTFEPGQRLFS